MVTCDNNEHYGNNDSEHCFDVPEITFGLPPDKKRDLPTKSKNLKVMHILKILSM